MSKQFVKKDGLKLINGGYLVAKDDTPVFNEQFVRIQLRAEYVVKFAELAKGKNFTATKVDTLQDLEKEVREALNKIKPIVFVNVSAVGEMPITKALKDEALSFINFQEDTTKAEKINSFLQEFVILQEFEEFGLFFEENVVKLNKIYTMKDVIDAVTSVVDIIK
jgi:hypothetical protein